MTTACRKKTAFAKVSRTPEQTPFESRLEELGSGTAQAVKELFHHLQLPMPKIRDEYFHGHSGALLFLNKYSVVVRLERQDDGVQLYRYNDRRSILKPLASFEAGGAVVEICPGGEFEKDPWQFDLIKRELADEGVKVWDLGIRNVVRLPIITSETPNGLCVLGDRLTVMPAQNLRTCKKPLLNLQNEFYAPLISAMQDAWPEGRAAPDAKKISHFWDQCAVFKDAGKMISGWNNFEEFDDGDFPTQALAATKAAAFYGELLEKQGGSQKVVTLRRQGLKTPANRA